VTRRLLVVDDEPDIREVAATALGLLGGYEVRTAGSGADALDALRDEVPDAVLLDVQMPGMDGPTTLAAIRGDADAAMAGVPVIVFTANAPARTREQVESLGVAGIVAKPFDPVTLGDEVARLLGWA
jgi:CheY-like chemotaxis protein